MKQVKEPGWLTKILSFLSALFAAAKDPTRVSPELYKARMSVCDGCEFKRENKCLACGCNIPLKGKLKVWSCDLGKWQEVDSQHNLVQLDPLTEKLERRLREPDTRPFVVKHNGDVLIKDSIVPVPEDYEWTDELEDGWAVYRHVSKPQPCVFRRMAKRRGLTVEPLCLVQLGPAKQIDFGTCVGCDKAISLKCQKDTHQ